MRRPSARRNTRRSNNGLENSFQTTRGDGQLVQRDSQLDWTDRLRMPKRVSTPSFRTITTILQQSVLATSLTTSQFAALAFTLQNNVPDYANMAFDQYRILMVECDILPSASQNLAAAATLTSGTYASCIDYDDSNALTTVQQCLNYDNAIMHRSYERSTRTFVPRAAVAAYSGAFTSYANVAGLWYDKSSSNVTYYGLKLAAPSSSTSTVFDMVTRCLVEFRRKI